jgi:cytochrome oxidase Cu insertion factor (SCO1/SenC/PrrC family)
MNLRNRRRLQAGLIVAIFVVPVIVMLGLTLNGWTPQGRSYGQRIQPERDLADVPVQLADGKSFTFDNHDAVWTLVALPGPGCAEMCLRQLDLVHRVQITLDRQADKLRLVYLGEPPQGAAIAGFEKVWTLATTPSHALDDLRPTPPDSVSALLVTPSGKAMLRYASGFDPEGLRQDLKKAVKVAL